MKAETLWALNVVDHNYSFNSSSVAGELFRIMFPESEIVQEFHCGERKSNYLITSSTAPCVQQLLQDNIWQSNDYVLMYD